MNKEHIKSIVLFVLVICNLFLGSEILMTKKLWPDGYNFFINTKKTDWYSTFSNFLKGSSADDSSKNDISKPNNIIINTGYQTTRIALKSSHEKFDNVYSVCSQILKEALSAQSKDWTYVTADEWYKLLSARSVYMCYSTQFKSSLFAEFEGCKNSEISSLMENIDGVVVDGGDKAGIYLKGDDKYIKCTLNTSDDELSDIINYFQQAFDETDSNSDIINYSFELLFDKVLENQHTVIESMIPIYSTPINYNLINADNPIIKHDSSINMNSVNRILTLFDINENSVRRYTEAGGTMVFVENNGTLKIHLNGLIEYSAGNGSAGLKLTEKVGAYNNMCAAADFMDNINEVTGAGENMMIASYDIAAVPSVGMSFDYSVDGIPVEITSSEINHAVEIKMENGYLKEYKHLLRSYDMTQEVRQIPLYIEDLDKLIAENPSVEHTYIEKMYVCYRDDITQGIKQAGWHLQRGVKL